MGANDRFGFILTSLTHNPIPVLYSDFVGEREMKTASETFYNRLFSRRFSETNSSLVENIQHLVAEEVVIDGGGTTCGEPLKHFFNEH